MKERILASVALLLLLPLIGGAQATSKVVADISFAFHAGKDVLPAGVYDFKPGNSDTVMTIRNTQTNSSIMTPVVTRLAQRPGDEAAIVFDKVGDQYYISEIHVPGIDGFHLTGAPGPHTHVTVRAKK